MEFVICLLIVFRGKIFFKSVNFNDRRLNKRACNLCAQTEYRFERSAHSSVSTPAKLKGMYRFMNNEKVDPDTLFSGFIKSSSENLTVDNVLFIQDTTEMNFSWRKIDIPNLGPVGNGKDQGFFVHSGIFVNPTDGEVLGAGSLKNWTRRWDIKTTQNESHKLKPISEKESYRWLSSIIESRQILPQEIKMTVVADREADIFDLFWQHANGSLGKNIDLVIRASRNRKLVDEPLFFNDTVNNLPVLGTYDLSVIPTASQTKRNTTMEIRYSKIVMEVPKTHSKKKFSSIDNIYVVDVKEQNPPSDGEKIHWTILTTKPVETIDLALEIVQIYKQRWVIELLFRIIKSGYRVEEAQYDDGKALMKWCTIRIMMAIRMLNMITNRHVKTLNSCLSFLTKDEVDFLLLYEKCAIPPKSKVSRPPKKSVAWAIQLISILGGYKALPSAGPPGQMTIWRGMIALENAMIGYQMRADLDVGRG